jgi:membrane protein YdbS with pleckstrin-like domain
MTLDRLHLVSLQIAHLLFSHRSELTLGFWKAIELTQFALHIAVFILKAATVLLLYAVHNLILVLLWAIGAIMVFIVLVTIYRLVQLVKNRYEVIKKTSHVIQGLVKKIVIYS